MYYNEESVIFYNDKFVKAKKSKTSTYRQKLHYNNGIFESNQSHSSLSATEIFKYKDLYEFEGFGTAVMSVNSNSSENTLTEIANKLLKKQNLSKKLYTRYIKTYR